MLVQKNSSLYILYTEPTHLYNKQRYPKSQLVFAYLIINFEECGLPFLPQPHPTLFCLSQRVDIIYRVFQQLKANFQCHNNSSVNQSPVFIFYDFTRVRDFICVVILRIELLITFKILACHGSDGMFDISLHFFSELPSSQPLLDIFMQVLQ